LESVSSPAELHWKRRIALAALTDANKLNSEVSPNELYTVTESTVPIVVDEGFDSKTGELGNHTLDNTISENLSVVNSSADIPDVVDVVVDITMNNTCGDTPKCHDVVEVKTKKIEVEYDFCSFVSNHVEEFHQHIRQRHDNIQDLPWNSSLVRSGHPAKVTFSKTVERPRSGHIKQTDKWEEMCKALDLL